MRSVAVILLVLLASGCGGDGKLVMQLSLPAERRLDPTVECYAQGGETRCDRTDPRLSRFALRITKAGGPISQEALFVSRGDVTVGQVPFGEPFDLRLAGQTSTGQLLGLGVIRQVEVSGGGDTIVAVQFRKPIAYVAAGKELLVLDTAASSATTTQLPSIAAPIAPVAVTATANGMMVVAVASNRLIVYRTSDHQKAAEIPLSSPAHCVRVSPDSRYAFLCHESPAELSSVDLLSQSPTAIGRGVKDVPTEIAFDRDGKHGWVLVQGIDRQVDTAAACAQNPPNSTLVRVSYGSPTDATGAHFVPLFGVGLPHPASAVAVHPGTGKLLVSFPCKGEVAQLDPTAAQVAQVSTVVSIPHPHDISVTDDHIIVISKDASPTSSSGQALLLPVGGEASAPLTRSFKIPDISLPLTSEASSAGLFSWISQPKPDLVFYGAAVTPDGQRALALYRVTYHSQLQIGSINPCSYRTEIAATGYIVVDLTSGTVLSNRLAQLAFKECSANCVTQGSQPLTDPATCEAVFRATLRKQGVLAPADFLPKSAAMLFGG